MRVAHYADLMDRIVGGIEEAVKNQRKALELNGIEYTEEPDLTADVLHLNIVDPKSLYYAVRASLKDVPVVMGVHTTHEDFRESFRLSNLLSPLIKIYIDFFYGWADRLIVPSSYTRNVLRRDLDLEEGKIEVVSNGIDTSKMEGFREIEEEVREKYGEDSTVVFSVGTVFGRKGVKDFVETARQKPDTEFYWFGKVMPEKLTGKEATRAVKEAPENVTFTGYVEDIREAFALGDIFFYPTKTENQGIPAIEAAYCEKPIVLRDIEAFEEDFEHGENCLKGESMEDFLEMIQELEENTALREKLSECAGETAEQHTLEKVGEELRNVYNDLLET